MMQECYPSGCIVIQKYKFCKTKYIIDQIKRRFELMVKGIYFD
jgi:hypothetical protein